MQTLKLNKKTLVRLASKEMQDLTGGKKIAAEAPSETRGSNCDSVNTKLTKVSRCC